MPKKVKFINNEQKVNTFCEYIRLGCSIKGACGGVGLNDSYYYQIMKKGQEDVDNGIESDEARFLHTIKKAEQEFETRNLEIIQRHAVDDWKASAWLLERRRQKEYVVRQDIAFSTPDKITINMDVKKDGDN